MVENPMLLFDIHKDNPLLIRYLKNCNSEKTQVRREVDKALRGAIGSCIQQCIDSLPQVENLSSSLQALDIHLAKAEEILTTFETRLTEVTENIRICHETSTKTKELINQKQTELSVLETYIKQILVTPDMIQCICEGKVDSNYLQQMETIEKKIECCKQPGVQINLSAREALPELEKLYTEGLKRIKSHLMNAFTCFTKSQTNVQILQRNVLNSKSLFSFLAMNDPSSSVQLRTHYVTIMTNVHHSRYSNYCTALWRHFPTEGLATSNDTLGQSSRFNGAMTTFFGHRPTIDPDPKPQFFTSAGRSDIFSRLREDPSLTERVVKTSGESSSSSSVEAQTTTTSGVIAGKSTCNLLEQFRSTLRLLMDFSTSEYLFISQFFMSKVEPFVVVNDHGDDEIANHHPSFLSRHQLEILFQDLTKRTLDYGYSYWSRLIACCWDALDVLCIIILCYHSRNIMESRRISILEKYFNSLLSMLWHRMETLIEMHCSSLKCSIESMYQEKPLAPHPYTIRFTSFTCAIDNIMLGAKHFENFEDKIKGHTRNLHSSLESFLQATSVDVFKSSPPPNTAPTAKLIFLINNMVSLVSINKGMCVAIDDDDQIRKSNSSKDFFFCGNSPKPRNSENDGFGGETKFGRYRKNN